MSPPSQPLVSIVLCTTGRTPTLLAKCIESLLAQEGPPFELLVVLNRSYDENFTSKFSAYPVRLFSEPKRGVNVARNAAIPRARADILVFVDDDVVAQPGWLCELVKGFENQSVACVTGRVIPDCPSFFQATANRVFSGELATRKWSLDLSDPNWYRKAFLVGFGCNMAFRRDFLVEHCLFPEDLGAGAVIGAIDETYMFLQVVRRGLQVRHIPDAAVTHYFEQDFKQLKRRWNAIHAAQVAFVLKMLVRGREIRWPTLKYAVSKPFQLLLRAVQSAARDEQEFCSLGDKLVGVPEGIRMYWKSRKKKS